MDESYCARVKAALQPQADAAKAVKMRAYMKERFSFLGIPSPLRRKVTLPLLRVGKGMTADWLLEQANALWAMPEREYQYVAIDLLARHHGAFTPGHLDALLRLVQEKSWWDSVDGIAGVVGDVLKRHRVPMGTADFCMDTAIRHPNLWVRRIALLHQLGWRADTDTERLFGYARALAQEKEFFIRKAIGWALRDYAWHDPVAVRHFLAETGERLSPLTIREASRHL